eukprot:TRINITY_DN5775_c5_g1_i1.p1 TRINITY_DN5775_c5_g1~~TRINITY_DN5775_c5_g1_i1.p1  ORF type:complete len:670 (+),score=231.02 TRINITY_DN5775_c5_g1_i1:59-2011(+)
MWAADPSTPMLSHSPERSSALPAPMGKAGTAAEPVGGGDCLWQGPVHVRLKLHDREWATETLTVHVSAPSSHRSGRGREVAIRLTSRDPFFLYAVRMSEDEYGKYKEQRRLTVDFNEFPRMVVALLEGCGKKGALPESPKQRQEEQHYAEVHIDSHAESTLKVIKEHQYGVFDMLSLQVMQEDDAGLRQHLAERAARLEGELQRCTEEKRQMSTRLTDQVERLTREVAHLTEQRDTLRDQLRQQIQEVQHKGEFGMQQLRESKERDLREHQLELASERRRLEERHDLIVKPLQQAASERDAEIAALNRSLREAQESLQAVTDKHELAQSQSSAARKESAALQSRVAELEERTLQQQRTLTENTLTIQKLEQEGKFRSEALETGGRQSKLLEQSRDQLQAQLSDFTARLKESEEARRQKEQELSKAHHILAQQHRHLETSKQKRQQQAEHLACKEQLIAEKDVQVSQQRVEIRGLKDQLDQEQDRARQLAQQVTQLTADLQSQTSLQEGMMKCYSRQVRYPPLTSVSAGLDSTERVRAAISSGGLRNEFGLHSMTTASALPPRAQAGSLPQSPALRPAELSQATPQSARSRGEGLVSALAHQKLIEEDRASSGRGAASPDLGQPASTSAIIPERRPVASNFFPSAVRPTAP